MSAKWNVVFRNDVNNVGDIASNPLQYFLKESEYNIIDVDTIAKETYDDSLPTVCGGGGLIANEYFGKNIELVLSHPDKNSIEHVFEERWMLSNRKYENLQTKFNQELATLVQKYSSQIENNDTPKVLWGAGHNVRDWNAQSKDAVVKYPKYLVRFNKVGIRDYTPSNDHPWAPCASCMHPALQKKYPTKNKVIFFEHKKQLIKGTEFGPDPIPRFVNSGGNIEQTIELLGSSETIITNSYHGAYWGILLGKRVFVVAPWSSKFYYMKHQPTFLMNTKKWWENLDECDVYPHALNECISATEKFWDDIKGMA